MSYLGRSPSTQIYRKIVIIGDDSTTAFDLGFPAAATSGVLVANLTQGFIYEPDQDYTFDTSPFTYTIVFDSAIPDEDRVLIIWLGIATAHPVDITPLGLRVDTFVGDDVETDFVLSHDPQIKSNTQVYFDGVYQEKDTYSVSGPIVSFADPPEDSVNIEIISIQAREVVIGVPSEESIIATMFNLDDLENIKDALEIPDPVPTPNAGEEFTFIDGGSDLTLDGLGPPNIHMLLDDDATVQDVNVDEAGKIYSFYIMLEQDGTGGHSVTLPGTTVWPYGEVPEFPTDPGDIAKLTLETWDQGTTWHASWVGAEYGS